MSNYATTSIRNDLFNKKVVPLACTAVHHALETSRVESNQITHLIAVTCTGFANPGFDVALIEQGLVPPTVHRYSLGFMGCYGAFPALELAYMIARADPSAHILCICAELCSLHFQPHLGTFDDILSSVLFADGVAVVVVGRNSDVLSSIVPRIRSFESRLLPEGEEDMSWSIGDTGFKIVLSPYVSRIIGNAIEELIPESWEQQKGGPDHWVVHPGGRSILDRVQERLGLSEDKLEDSRMILRDFGNMSSATVLFALDRLMRSARLQPNQRIGMLGFGPGLTVKSLLLET
jgi:predicted naringenin-chalcone synthase